MTSGSGSNLCNICCEKYNKTVNTKVLCEFAGCGFEACKTCIRTYLLGTTNDPHCMKCKNLLSAKFLVENLNHSYMNNDYRKHRKLLLVDREISRTPELMNLVERTKKIDDCNVELAKLVEEYNKIRKLFNDIGTSVSNKKFELYQIKNGKDSKEERKKFIMPCPGDNCKGYLSTQYKCEICKLYTCPDCFEIIGYTKEDPHTCIEDNLKSAELIKKETKGCPQCGVRIFKISGCDQMWCTECKVAFSWNTGKIIISENIHNPHYYNYLRENGNNGGAAPRNPGDVLCGGLIPFYSLNHITRFLLKLEGGNGANNEVMVNISENNNIVKEFTNKYNIQNCNQIITMVSNLHRFVNHITNVDLIGCRTRVRTLGNFDELTVQYILNKKSKEELATSIFKNDNLRKKNVELLNIYELLSVVGVERFNGLYQYYVNNSSNANTANLLTTFIVLIVDMITEYNNLINYCNKQLIIISYTYNQSVGVINTRYGNYKVIPGKYKQSDLVRLEKVEAKCIGLGEGSCSYH